MLQPLCWSHKLQVTGRRWRRIKADKGKKIKDKGGRFNLVTSYKLQVTRDKQPLLCFMVFVGRISAAPSDKATNLVAFFVTCDL